METNDKNTLMAIRDLSVTYKTRLGDGKRRWTACHLIFLGEI